MRFSPWPESTGVIGIAGGGGRCFSCGRDWKANVPHLLSRSRYFDVIRSSVLSEKSSSLSIFSSVSTLGMPTALSAKSVCVIARQHLIEERTTDKRKDKNI